MADCARAAGLHLPAAVLFIALIGAAALLAGPIAAWRWTAAYWAVLCALGAALLAGWRLQRYLLAPLAALETSLARICQGEPGASAALQPGPSGALAGIVREIATLNAELTDLYEDMDARVARQTARLAQKTASLKILYEVAATINQAEQMDEMLLRFLRMLKEMVNGRAATVRLLTADGGARLVGVIGLDDALVAAQPTSPLDLCLCGTLLAPGELVCNHDARYCARIYGRRMLASDKIETVTVPLKHHDELLGVYTIFVDRPGVTVREDILQLLATIGQHIGVAVAKYRADAEARRLSIVEERNALAHELHDSLAQTLAGLRLQVRMLSDALAETPIAPAARADLQRLRGSLDEAHAELRELLANFRAPLDRRGLVPALEQLAHTFERETGIATFVQLRGAALQLSAAEELHVLRIAQEALHNIRKHAQARTVRILLRRDAEGGHTLLIEDDGLGFTPTPPASAPRPGERIGLAILEERARRIGGTLTIESEPGEGTRVELRFGARTARCGSS